MPFALRSFRFFRAWFADPWVLFTHYLMTDKASKINGNRNNAHNGNITRPPNPDVKFPMNVQAGEAFATGVFRDDLGFQIRQGCHFVRAYNCHCAPKTNQDTTSSWPGRMWNYDLDTMTLNHSLANPMPLLPLTCGERSADLPSDPEGKVLTTRCIKILVDKYHRNHGEMETSVVGALQRGEPHVDAACIVLFPPYVECPELGKQRTHEYSRAGSHLSSERPRFGDSRI